MYFASFFLKLYLCHIFAVTEFFQILKAKSHFHSSNVECYYNVTHDFSFFFKNITLWQMIMIIHITLKFH